MNFISEFNVLAIVYNGIGDLLFGEWQSCVRRDMSTNVFCEINVFYSFQFRILKLSLHSQDWNIHLFQQFVNIFKRLFGRYLCHFLSFVLTIIFDEKNPNMF